MQILSVRTVGSTISFSLISKKHKSIKIEFLKSIDLNSVDDPNAVLQKYLSVESDRDSAEVVGGLSGDQIFIRQLKVPVKSPRALSKALPFQLESLIPFASNPDARVVVTKKREGKAGYQVTPFAFLQRHLDECLEEYNAIGLDPEWISCIPQALKRFARFLAPATDSMIACCVEKGATHIVSIISGEIDVSLTLHKGSEALDDEAFSREIKRSIAYCLQRDEAGKVETILQLGAVDFQQMDLGFESTPIENTTIIDDDKLKRYAIEIGLGLDVAVQDGRTVQLRRGESIAQNHFQRGLFGAGVLFGGAVLASLLLGGISTYMLSGKKRTLKTRIENAIGKEVAPYTSSEEWIDLIDKERVALKKKGPTIGFHKWPVGVAQLLEYISTHPDLQEGVEVQRLGYFLERYPTIGNPLEPLKVKVDLTISCTSPLIARDFHQALLNNKEKYINGKEPIHWERGESAYRAIFYLKNPF